MNYQEEIINLVRAIRSESILRKIYRYVYRLFIKT